MSLHSDLIEAPRLKAPRHFSSHLAPIDKFLLDDERPGYPMTFVIQMECRGVVQPEAFEEALEEARRRHPLLCSLVGVGRRGMLSWVDGGELRPAVDWGAWDEPLDCPREAIDLSAEIGLRIWVRQAAERALVVMQFHHAATDGTGAFRFIGDLLAIYDQRLGGERSQLLPLEPSLLRERRGRMADAYARGSARELLAAGGSLLTGVFARRAAMLAEPAEHAAGEFPGIETHTFTPGETRGLRAAADRANAMLNDLLIARLLIALRDWNIQRSGRPPRRPLRVMMPVDLRESRETEMPAANMVGYTFLTRHARGCLGERALLESIRDETTRIKHHHLGKRFIDAISAAERFPWLVPWLLRRHWCLATALLTNNGDPARRITARLPREGGLLTSGGLIVERFSGVPPLRRKTRAALAAMIYAKRLTLSLRCDPAVFGPEQTRNVLQLYVERLLASAAEGGA